MTQHPETTLVPPSVSSLEALTVSTVLRGFLTRWKMFGIAVLAAWVIGAVFILTVSPQYEADTAFYYVEQNGTAQTSSSNSGFAALASSVGFGAPRASGRDVALAILQSRQLATDFVQRYNLLPVLFADSWDGKNGTWNVEPEKVPTPADGAAALREILTMADDTDRGVAKITLRLPDQKLVAPLVNRFLKMGDDILRKRAQDESQQRLSYLEQQLAKTGINELRSSITNLIEQDMKLLTFSRTQANFAFKIIDPAIQPKYPAWPRKGILLVVLTILALIGAGVSSVFLDLRRTGYFL